MIQEIEDVIGIDATDAIRCSAKTGEGVDDVIEAVIARIPPPVGNPDGPLKALIIDSWFDNYVGVVILVRVVDGSLKPKDKILLMATGALHLVEQVGVFTPKSLQRESLGAGEVGYVISGIKELKDAKVGDTVTLADRRAEAPLPGFKEIKPQVFAGLYPIESNQYEALRDALAKLQLNDSSLRYEPETSQALGFGFRCGFLGLLHMDIVQERLEREYDMELITTAPTVVYQVKLRDGTVIEIDNPSKLPDLSRIEEIREPMIRATILMPQEYVGPVITLCTQKRGVQVNMQYVGRQVILTYDMPLNEVVMDFFDKLKSNSRGYASLDYEFLEFRAGDLVKLDIQINGEKVDALSLIVHRENSVYRGRDLATRMRKLIPRQMFDVAVQAAIGANIIARENISALRKNVLAKCYGGDITRKKKLLEKQKAGKKRMKQVGSRRDSAGGVPRHPAGGGQVDAGRTQLGTHRARSRAAPRPRSSAGTRRVRKGPRSGHPQGHPRDRLAGALHRAHGHAAQVHRLRGGAADRGASPPGSSGWSTRRMLAPRRAEGRVPSPSSWTWRGPSSR